jgi:hypothetical protein
MKSRKKEKIKGKIRDFFNFQGKGRKSITLFEDSQATPARPPDRHNVKDEH